MLYKKMSKNLQYEQSGKRIKYYNLENKLVGEVEQLVDKTFKKIHYTNFRCDKKLMTQKMLGEILNVWIQSTTQLPLEKLLIEAFPMSKGDFEKIYYYYEGLYGKNIHLILLNPNPDNTLDVEINFKNPKTTHYIQQAYLRNFSTNESKWKPKNKKDKARIFCFDKLEGKLINVGNTEAERHYGPKISSIGKIDYYHSLYMEQFMRNSLEKFIPPLFEKIISTKSLDRLTTEEKVKLIQYIVFIRSRTVEAREHLREVLEKGTTILAKKNGFDIKEGELKWDNIDLRLSHEVHILSQIDPDEHFKDYFQLFYYKWSLIKARLPDFFITCDTPVILNNKYYDQNVKPKERIITKQQKAQIKDHAKLKGAQAVLQLSTKDRGRAPLVKGIEIYLPISPSLCLVIHDKHEGIKPLKIKQINKEIVLQSEQYIFSKYNKLGFIQKILIKHPDVIKKTGRRFDLDDIKLDNQNNG